MKKIYLVIYSDCVMFGNFDNNGDFYYYEKFDYYKNIHNNNSIDTEFLSLLIAYKMNHKIEVIDKRHLLFN